MLNFNFVYKKAWEKYGEIAQMIVALEELSELQKEITKYLRGKDNFENIEEEIADVELMIAQIKYGLNLNEDNIQHIKENKVNRLLNKW